MAAVVSGHGSLKDKRSVRPMRDDFVVALEETSSRITDPVAKLRYLRGSIARYEERAARGLERSPRRFGPLAFALTLLATSGFAAAGYYFSRPAPPAPVVAATPPPVAEPLPALPAGVLPAKIWLVEKNEVSEQYSNGLRIDTTFETPSEPRYFRVFESPRGMRDEVYTQPIGILFHTSESDIWPLDESYNENLRTSSQSLLRYLKRNRVYNYLIDRFGRVFRVVPDESKANHAGHSVWTRDKQIYLSLNNAFLGLSFETRWEGGRALPITAAQLAAGRNLTDWLRQRFEIAADMCVGHGLVSVNAKKHLIGHHVDWARGFPFEAFGLPDQYKRLAPHVALFGFGYDEEFLKVMGEPWPGVREAERLLDSAAAGRGKTTDDVRRERQALFDRWVAEQTKDQEAAAGRRDAEARRGAGLRTPPLNGTNRDAASRPDAPYNGHLGPQALRSGG